MPIGKNVGVYANGALLGAGMVRRGECGAAVDWLALLAAKAVYAWDGTSGLSADRLTWTDLVAGKVVTAAFAPGAATLNGHAAVNITVANQGYRRATADVVVANPFSILAVVSPTVTSLPIQYLFDTATGRYIAAAVVSGGNSIGIFDGSWRISGSAIATAQVLRWTHDGATTQIFRNGVQVGATITGAPRSIAGSVGVFGNFSSGSDAMFGIAAHLSLYSSAAFAAEVEAAAIARFGL